MLRTKQQTLTHYFVGEFGHILFLPFGLLKAEYRENKHKMSINFRSTQVNPRF